MSSRAPTLSDADLGVVSLVDSRQQALASAASSAETIKNLSRHARV